MVDATPAAARPKPAKPAAARAPAARTVAARPALVNESTLQAIDRSAQAERGAARTAGRPR
jgi:hypothetical protein